jgi:hypothetical protein
VGHPHGVSVGARSQRHPRKRGVPDSLVGLPHLCELLGNGSAGEYYQAVDLAMSGGEQILPSTAEVGAAERPPNHPKAKGGSFPPTGLQTCAHQNSPGVHQEEGIQ